MWVLGIEHRSTGDAAKCSLHLSCPLHSWLSFLYVTLCYPSPLTSCPFLIYFYLINILHQNSRSPHNRFTEVFAVVRFSCGSPSVFEGLTVQWEIAKRMALKSLQGKVKRGWTSPEDVDRGGPQSEWRKQHIEGHEKKTRNGTRVRRAVGGGLLTAGWPQAAPLVYRAVNRMLNKTAPLCL